MYKQFFWLVPGSLWHKLYIYTNLRNVYRICGPRAVAWEQRAWMLIHLISLGDPPVNPKFTPLYLRSNWIQHYELPLTPYANK